MVLIDEAFQQCLWISACSEAPRGKTVSESNCLLQSIFLHSLARFLTFAPSLLPTPPHPTPPPNHYPPNRHIFCPHLSFQPPTSPNIPFLFFSLSVAIYLGIKKRQSPGPPDAAGM